MKKLCSWIFSIAVVISTTFGANASDFIPARQTDALSQEALNERTAFNMTLERRVRHHNSVAIDNAPHYVNAKAATDIPDLIGNIYYSAEAPARGLYSLKTSADDSYVQIGEAITEFEWGGVEKDGIYYSTYMMPFMGGAFIVRMVGLDATNGDVLYDVTPWDDLSCDFRFIPESQAYDPTTGAIYGICWNKTGNKFALCKMDYPADGKPQSTQIKEYGKGVAEDMRWDAIACDANGQLWAITYDTEYDDEGKAVNVSNLVKLNKKTGEYDVVGPTGLYPAYHGDATIDLESGRMFWTICDSDFKSFLCEIDLTTGKAEKLYEFPGEDEILGLEVAPPMATDKAPATVTDMVADFPKGALSGSIDFKAPSTLYDGSNGSGTLTYHVLVNREEKASGSTSFGANVSAAIELDSVGFYNFDVYVSNAAGNGPRTRVRTFVGNGVPAAPKNVKATYEEWDINITWDAVTESVDGGYVDPEQITYTIIRYGHRAYFDGETSDYEEILAENVQGTSYVIDNEEGNPVPVSLIYELSRYEIVANYADKSSEAGCSNSIVWGGYSVPYTNNIDKAEDLGGFTIIDANNDNIRWKFDKAEKAATIEFNQYEVMDDWLITPGIELIKDKAYNFSYKAKRYDISYPEHMEVKYGKGNAVADMTETILEVSPVEGTEYQTYEFTITPAESGVYFIGFHGCSAKYMYNIWIDDIYVSEGISSKAPDIVEIVNAAGDPDGGLKITVNFKAPTKTIDGDKLTELTSIDVFGSDLTIPLQTFDNPTPGQSLLFEDTPENGGLHRYTFVASNLNGRGYGTSVEVFAGTDIPAAPQNVRMVETANYGEVTISWDAVTTDRNGNAINPKLVTYSIYELDGEYASDLVAGNLTGTSYTFQAMTEDQVFAQYIIYSKTVSGESLDGSLTDMIPVGFPYSSIYESFTDGYLYYAWGIDVSGGGEWDVLTTGQDDFQPQDNDGGFAAMYGRYTTNYSDLYTGKVEIREDMLSPTLSFYRFVMGSDDSNEMTILVRELDGDWERIDSRKCNDISAKRGWVRTDVSLDAYKGKIIQIAFRATVGQYCYSFLDNIRLNSLVDNDLSIREISAPSKAVCGEEIAVNVVVENEGKFDADGGCIELYSDDVIVASENVGKLAPEEKVEMIFNVALSAIAEKAVKIHAVVVYSADENLVNNTSDVVYIEPVISKLPGVDNLTGELAADGSALLSWNVPDTVTGVCTETFEDAESWAHEYDQWTFVDLDGLTAGGFNDIVLPGITMDETKTSFFIFDDSDEQYGEDFAAHSGNKYMTSMFSMFFEQLDDWAISPELSGEAQTISLYAKSYDSRYTETMEIYYSDGSVDPNDFIDVARVEKVAAQWALYSYELPAGAKRFAIRSCASDSYLLMIDDVSYVPFYANATVLGYNIYRDGTKLNNQLVTATFYTDTEFGSGTHFYQVTAVYDKGESKGSEKLWLSTDGIADVTIGIVIAAGDNCLLISGAEGMNVSVASVDGKTVFFGKGKAELRIPVESGIYIVNAGNKVVKILVK